MKRHVIIALVALSYFLVLSHEAAAFWIWTPKDKKFIGPKYATKDTPEEQFKWAMKFYEEKDYKRAAEEFERLVLNFKDSTVAPDAQYYVGRSYEALGKDYPAFQAYQRTIDSYPFTKRIDEIIEREYNIGSAIYKKHSGKLMGKEIMTDLERAIEIFQKAKENSPFGEYGDKSQYMVSQCYKKSEQYVEAVKSFQKLVDEYPKSPLADKARYEVAQCTYMSSLKPDYDQEMTEEAIKEFKRISETREGMEISEKAEETISLLENKKAESIFNTAKFYERQKHYKSAAIYYEEVLKEYPRSSFSKQARDKLDAMESLMEKEKARAEKKAKKAVKEPKAEKAEKAEEPKIETAKAVEPVKAEEPTKAEEPVKAEKPKAEITKTEEPVKAEEPKVEAAKMEEPKEEPKITLAKAEKTEKKKSIMSLFTFGYSTHSALPESERSVYVNNFANKIPVTEEVSDSRAYYPYRAGMEASITRKVIDRFIFDGNYEIKDAENAYFMLKGDLVDYKREPLNYDANNNVLEYRLSVVVNMELSEVKTGKSVWRENNFAGESTYRTQGQFAKGESAAMQDAITDLARRIVERTVENW